MNEGKKIIILFVVVLVAIIGIFGLNYFTSKDEEKLMGKYDKLINSKEEQIIYIGRPTCSYCVQFQPILQNMSKEYKIDYEYINMDDLSQASFSQILKQLKIDEEKFGTPYLAIVKEGKVVASQPGYTDKEGLFNFFQKNSIIGKDEKLKLEDENLTKINYSKYEELLNSQEKQIVVIGQTGCSACDSAKPVLSDIALQNQITIHYLNISDLSEEEHTKLTKSLPILGEDFGTPLTLIIENGKLVDSSKGFLSKETYIEFFTKNEIMK